MRGDRISTIGRVLRRLPMAFEGMFPGKADAAPDPPSVDGRKPLFAADALYVPAASATATGWRFPVGNGPRAGTGRDDSERGDPCPRGSGTRLSIRVFVRFEGAVTDRNQPLLALASVALPASAWRQSDHSDPRLQKSIAPRSGLKSRPKSPTPPPRACARKPHPNRDSPKPKNILDPSQWG